ncbi:Sec-independent protein translocase subunit TatA [Nocardia sp. BSTN01]|uniref:Sec-independent protein translocase subunit TatA n=1 Tax=Nocardia sp. BSTN01 TaxID=2783665 RepID=UPI00188ED32C|nr:Sec-independent protein translocase subunit TatA [Nocardia sp. BSTN01]MBF5001636.1 Sec-independent protein translocase subunit TatA [Nocardia sp. BSTN01]
MGSLSPTHWLIIALVVVVLFGAKRLPDTARGLGRSLRIFKSEMSEMHSEDSGSPNTASASVPDAGHRAAPAAPLPPGRPATPSSSAVEDRHRS